MKNPYVPDADAEGYPVVVAQPKPGSEDEIAFRPESIVILSGKKYSQAEILEKNGGTLHFGTSNRSRTNARPYIRAV